MRVGVVQMCSTDDLPRNLALAEAGIAQAVADGADFIALPEAFPFLRREGQPIPNVAAVEAAARGALESWAREHRCWLLGGSIPETIDGSARVYNTTLLFDPSGSVVARYRKIHLFDIDLGELDANCECFRESDTYAPGEEVVVAETPFGGLGLSICYDVRFPELYRALIDANARWICVPSAFARATGPFHWEVLLRARAIESQCYVIAPAQCGEHSPERASHGHSMVIDPWGEILAEGGNAPTVLVVDCPDEAIDRVRIGVPSLRNRRL
ncbi:MAG: carbon-nitrogen hydrolase family protein [Myxococcota bacterium]|nr:carbon-nitrogen hydrolase family protein [Myxococcota bacterium]